MCVCARACVYVRACSYESICICVPSCVCTNVCPYYTTWTRLHSLTCSPSLCLCLHTVSVSMSAHRLCRSVCTPTIISRLPCLGLSQPHSLHHTLPALSQPTRCPGWHHSGAVVCRFKTGKAAATNAVPPTGLRDICQVNFQTLAIY